MEAKEGITTFYSLLHVPTPCHFITSGSPAYLLRTTYSINSDKINSNNDKDKDKEEELVEQGLERVHHKQEVEGNTTENRDEENDKQNK